MSDLQLFEEETPAPAELAIAPEDLGIDETSMPVVVMATEQDRDRLAADTMPLMQILPADFRLPALTRFVPDLAIKARIDTALTYVQSIEIEGKGLEALKLIDAGLNELNAAIAAGEAHFEEPASIAYDLHRHVTGTRGAWVNDPKAVVKKIGTAVWKETERLKAAAAAEQQRLQDEANAKAREEARIAAEQAAKNRAPAPIIEKLEQQAKTATAPPVIAQAVAPPLSDNSVVTTWKARLASIAEDADEQAPALTALTPEQRQDVIRLFKAIVDGRHDLLSLVSVNYGAINKLAVAQESTFNVPGFVAYKTGGTRKKAQRGGRR